MGRARRGRGEGSVYQRKDGLWEASVSLGALADGTRKRVSVYGNTKAESLAKLEAAKAKYRAGGVPAGDRLTVGELVKRWMEAEIVPARRASTIRRYKQIVKHLDKVIGHVKTRDLTPAVVDDMVTTLRAKKVGDRTMQLCRGLLQTACTYGVRLGVVASNPVPASPRVKVDKKPPTFLDPAQARAFLAAAQAEGTAAHALYALALGGGLRPGELLGLNVEDVTADGRSVRVVRTVVELGGVLKENPPKSKASRRTVLLDPATAAAVKAQRDAVGSGPLFPTSKGTRLSPRNVAGRLFARIREAAGSPAGLTPHDLRHTHASLLLSAGCSVRAVAARLGHEDPSLTLRVYGHVMPADADILAGEIGRILAVRERGESS